MRWLKIFTLNYNNSQRINFESMKGLVTSLNFTDKIVIENPFKIKRKLGFGRKFSKII